MSIRSPGICLPASQEMAQDLILGIPNIDNVVDSRIYEVFKLIPKWTLQYPQNEPLFEYQKFNSFKGAGTKENVNWSHLDRDLIAWYTLTSKKT